MKQKFNALALRTALGITTAQYELVKPTLELADSLSESLLAELLKHGIADRTTARPFVVYYIATKRKGAIDIVYEGQRGLTFGYGTKYERQVTRILDKIFGDTQVDTDKPRKKSNKTDKVASLFKQWQSLTASEKRRFTTLQLKAN